MVGSPVLTFHVGVHQHAGNGVKASLSEVGQLFVIQDLPPAVPREPYSSSPSLSSVNVLVYLLIILITFLL